MKKMNTTMKMKTKKNGIIDIDTLKDGDTFYYVKRVYLGSQKTYQVFPYKWWKKYSNCFNPDLMFETKEKAYFKALELSELERN